MGIERVIKEPSLRGVTESLPPYEEMAETLLQRHHNDPVVTREEVEELLGERGNLESLLIEYVNKGYLMHGSSSLTRELQPRQARDANEDPQNRLNAVYAGVVPGESLFFSMHRSNKVASLHSEA